jgi:glycosyltransferase involved in cell wall biosynthesis
MPAVRNVFACLVHESPECVADLVRNLRALDPSSEILLYNGGKNGSLLAGFPCERYGAVVHPSPQPLEWGRLHDFALDCLRFSLDRSGFDTLTIVDSDQLAVRPGYSEHLARALAGRSGIGLFGSSAGPQPLSSQIGPVTAAQQERGLWLRWVRRFPNPEDAEEKLFHWTFWPSTVFTADAARDLLQLLARDAQLQGILRQTRIWATEEVILPTLVALLGYEVAEHPCSYDFVQYKQTYSGQQIEGALARPDVFWLHPVPRRYQDPLRTLIRERFGHYSNAAAADDAAPGSPLVSCIMPTRDRRDLVPQALRQFLRQDYPHAELIVVDDGDDKVADLIPPDPRLRYLALDGRRTVGAKRNLACEAARGEIILHWDDDDWMADWRIRYQVEHLLAAEADLCGLPRLYFHEPATGKAWQYSAPAGDKQWIAGATFCYRKDLWRAEPFADVDNGEDTRFLWSGRRRKVAPLADPGFYIARLHNGNTASKRESGGTWRPVSPSVLASLLAGLEGKVPHLPGPPLPPLSHPSGREGRPRIESGSELPLVSCVMPTRDRRELALRAVRYFLDQDYPERELVIVDDGAEPLAVPEDERIRRVRPPGPLSIGRKRNLGVERSRGEIVVHWDDDDWYAPDRIRYQIQPLLAGEADIAGLIAEHFYSVQGARFWGCTPQLHSRMFFADVHGRSIAYLRDVWKGRARYPDLSLGEDARFLQAALDHRSRLARLPNADKLVYVRHGANTWRFECGEFLLPAAWQEREVPGFLPEEDLAFYRALSKLPAFPV